MKKILPEGFFENPSGIFSDFDNDRDYILLCHCEHGNAVRGNLSLSFFASPIRYGRIATVAAATSQ